MHSENFSIESYSSNNIDPSNSKFDSTVMELGLRKALEDWVKGTTEMQGLTDDL